MGADECGGERGLCMENIQVGSLLENIQVGSLLDKIQR